MNRQVSVDSAALSILSMLPNTYGRPEAYRDLIGLCAHYAGVNHAMLSIRNKNMEFEFFDNFWESAFFHGFLEEAAISYEPVRSHDNWNEFEKRLKVGKTVIASQTPEGIKKKSNPFTKWQKNIGFDDCAVANLGEANGSWMMFGLHYKKDSVDTDRLRHFLSIIAKPIGVALQADMIGIGSGSAQAVLSYAEHFDKPVVILEQDAKLVDANRLGVQLLNSHPAFFKPTGKIGLTHADRNTQLKMLVNDTIQTSQINYMRIDDDCSGENMLAIITPSPCFRSVQGRQKTIALVTITTKSNIPAYLAPLKDTHDVKPAEMEFLKALSTGLSYHEIADLLRRDYDKIKEAFSNMFPRLGVKNQQELIRFLEKLPNNPNEY